MTRVNVTHLLKLSVKGGEDHKLAIAEAAVLFADAGYRVHDMTVWQDSPYRPDLIISKMDKFVTATGNMVNKTQTYWVEIVDSSMPPRDFVKTPNPIIRIDIGGCHTADERIAKIKQVAI